MSCNLLLAILCHAEALCNYVATSCHLSPVMNHAEMPLQKCREQGSERLCIEHVKHVPIYGTITSQCGSKHNHLPQHKYICDGPE